MRVELAEEAAVALQVDAALAVGHGCLNAALACVEQQVIAVGRVLGGGGGKELSDDNSFGQIEHGLRSGRIRECARAHLVGERRNI